MKGTSGNGSCRHASRSTTCVVRPRRAASSSPASAAPPRARFTVIASDNPTSRPSAAAVAGASPAAVGHVVGESAQRLTEERAVLPEGVERAYRGRLAHGAEPATIPFEVTVVGQANGAAGGQERRPVSDQAVANGAEVLEVARVEA